MKILAIQYNCKKSKISSSPAKINSSLSFGFIYSNRFGSFLEQNLGKKTFDETIMKIAYNNDLSGYFFEILKTTPIKNSLPGQIYEIGLYCLPEKYKNILQEPINIINYPIGENFFSTKEAAKDISDLLSDKTRMKSIIKKVEQECNNALKTKKKKGERNHNAF